MLTALAFVVLQSQEPGPVILPPGSSHEFQSMVYGVQAAVDGGDWAEAVRLARRLPKLSITIEWSETGLTDDQKLFFTRARDEAIKHWKAALPELDVRFAPKGDVKISFVETLPPNIDTVGPAGAVYLVSPADEEPVIEGVWALYRGVDKRPIDRLEVMNETTYAIGAYLGLARQIRAGNVTFRTEETYPVESKPTIADARLVKGIIEVADRIRRDVAAKKNPGIAAPQIVIDPDKFAPSPAGQADEMVVTLQVTNQGKGVLDYRLVPDCGCFIVPPYTDRLAPGQTTVVPIAINTLEFTGKLSKALFVYSNDPFYPVKRIPLETFVRPAYRFIDQMSEPSLIVDENGTVFETVLVVDESKGFKPTQVRVSGVTAAAEIDKQMWEGLVEGPNGEPAQRRKGYKIRALIAPNMPPGRLSLQFEVRTDDPQYFRTIHHNVQVQRGIVAVPLSIYFGQIQNEPARGSVVLTRPGRPYKVTKVESDTEFVKASIEPYRPDTEYKVVATFTGKAPIGRFVATIKVHTDDPKQPIIVVPVEGIVK